jgi:hypothetical protein
MVNCVALKGLSARQKLEALAAHYGIDREAMQAMSMLEFAACIAAAKSRGGAS